MHFSPQTTSYIEISRKALQANIEFIKERLPEGCIFSSVVKGNAYGHDIELFSRLAYECGVRHYSVFSAAEAAKIARGFGDKVTILCMGHLDEKEMQWANEQGIEYFISSQQALYNAIDTARRYHQTAVIHLEMETGMNRTGISTEALDVVLTTILENQQYITLKGVCTHLAGAESIANQERVMGQLEKFERIKSWLEQNGIVVAQYHVACSAVVVRLPTHLYNLARVGIMQYGYFPNDETYSHYLMQQQEQPNPLKRIMSWKSRVADIKKVRAGEYIGYGNSYLADTDKYIAIVPVGYAYGYSRSLSNHGKVLIKGRFANVIGTVNMNMLMAEVTDIPEVSIGDEVVLIGRQGKHELTVASFSELSNQLNYELLARLPMDIERRVV